ncbi:defensin-like protein 2 [Camellia sinensis]|uniref:defensin-like protein 2 n=1 Tax=Camellia sinensis TaxID=4442 RepID=UPI0010363681|nr:defensin-like protein 2 [Camellia sinensis]
MEHYQSEIEMGEKRVFYVLAVGMSLMVVGVDARNCDSQSHHFKGYCFSDRNWGNVCQTEGFVDGQCEGFPSKCFCIKACQKIINEEFQNRKDREV